MKYLVDTVAFLYFLKGESSSFTPHGQEILKNPDNEFAASVVTLWEIIIKFGLKKLDLKKKPGRWLLDEIVELGWQVLHVTPPHVLGVADLEVHHKDPFDRLLVSQAQVEQMILFSPDAILRKYLVTVEW